MIRKKRNILSSISLKLIHLAEYGQSISQNKTSAYFQTSVKW